jgi:hypothetical protein
MNNEKFRVKQILLNGRILFQQHIAKPMFALSPVATNSTALSVPPSVFAAPVSDAASTRLTAVALPAPLSGIPLSNDAQNQAPTVPAAAPEDNAQQTTSAFTAPLTGHLPASGPSTPFLAQLISQNAGVQEDNQIAIANTFAHFSPAPQYNEWVGYSIVKYRPSDAGLSSSDASPSAAATDNAGGDGIPSVPAAGDYRAYSATQSRNQSNLADSGPQLLAAG